MSESWTRSGLAKRPRSLVLNRLGQFGPVVPVIPYDDLDQAFEWSNDTEYGLAASVWSSDIPDALQVARRIESGSVFINAHRVGSSDMTIPFGDMKQSGLRGNHGMWTIDERSECRRSATGRATSSPSRIRFKYKRSRWLQDRRGHSMNRSQFDEYIAAFNRADFEGFTKFYADDVVFELGDMRTFNSRQEIENFYREVKSKVRETLTVLKTVIDDDGMAAEVETEFVALEDWPEFVSGPMKKGDVYKRRGLIMYDFKDGKFSYIRSARNRILINPWK